MGERMLLTDAQASLPPGGWKRAIAEAVGEERAVPLPGVFSVKQDGAPCLPHSK